MQQQNSLAPGSVNLIPADRAGGRAAQPEARNGAKRPIVPDVEDIVVHIGSAQPFQLGGRRIDLRTMQVRGVAANKLLLAAVCSVAPL